MADKIKPMDAFKSAKTLWPETTHISDAGWKMVKRWEGTGWLPLPRVEVDWSGTNGFFHNHQIIEMLQRNIYLDRAKLAVDRFHEVWGKEIEQPNETVVSSCELVDGDRNQIWHAFVVSSSCGQEETILVKPVLSLKGTNDVAEVVDAR